MGRKCEAAGRAEAGKRWNGKGGGVQSSAGMARILDCNSGSELQKRVVRKLYPNNDFFCFP